MVVKLSPRLARAATLVLLAYLGVALLGLAYGVVRIRADPSLLVVSIWGALPLLAAVFLLGFTRAEASLRLGLSLLLMALTATVLGAELVLLGLEDSEPEREAASRSGQGFDERSRLEVIDDLKAQGIDAVPDLHGRVIAHGGTDGVALDIVVEGRSIVPLAAAASNSEVVLCNESGPWVRYRSDERGYRNPPGLWELGEVDVVTVGDSFTMGLCMDDRDVPAERIRGQWPSTVNLGVPGAGPLLELATLREFGPTLSPRLVLWMYYEGNDLTDLPAEIEHPILSQYMEPGFRQDLGPVQSAVDEQIGDFLTVLASQEQSIGDPRGWRGLALSVLKLERIRTLAGFSASLGPPQDALPGLERVLAEAKQTVETWGGHLVFVYLPDYNRFALRGVGENHLGRRDVLDLVERVGIPAVDLLPDFAEHPAPKSLWAYPGSHYTVEGFDLLNQRLLDVVAGELGRGGT